NPKSYVTARGEFILDDGFVGSDVYSLTLGYAYLFNKNLQTRAEFRYDWAGEDVFADSRRGTFTSNQPTFLISAIASY
ncbi:MAG TPA: outer membrane beta-barrel protein, partial [Armatimonadota bacterium]|nr:outer membrane beta-barrel protein [Armatimonadota bacterium]